VAEFHGGWFLSVGVGWGGGYCTTGGNRRDAGIKEIAAFGTTNTGVILLGVANNGDVVGIDDIDTAEGLDRLRLRVEGITSNVIIPSLTVRIRSEEVDQKYIAILEVPNGPEPGYYTKNGVPYILHGSMSRPANPMEVYVLIKRHIEKE
jgi:ATP-dependent DNA helicase RecG